MRHQLRSVAILTRTYRYPRQTERRLRWICAVSVKAEVGWVSCCAHLTPRARSRAVILRYIPMIALAIASQP